MAELTWAQKAHVRASPERVWAWMTDYSEHDHASPAYRQAVGAGADHRAKRTIVSRTPTTVVLEDRWGGKQFRSTVTLDPAARTLRIDGGWGYTATWRAVPERGGTRVEVEGRMAPGGLFGLLLPLFGKKMREESEKDFRGHVAELEADLGAP